MKFLENIGNASTTATREGKKLGSNVNAASYTNKNDEVLVKLESNGIPVAAIPYVKFSSIESYNEWKDEKPKGLDMMLHGLYLFDCETSFDNQ